MKKDVSWGMFFEDNSRVADFINCVALDGDDRISESDVSEVKTKLPIGLKTNERQTITTKDRDVVRKVVLGTTILIVDVEAQETVDYGYPLRELGYIYGEYESQARSIRRQNKNEWQTGEEISSGELLYGFRKANRLNPTIVFLLYSGKEEWDGPLCLHDLLDMKDVPEKLKNLVMNFKINIVNVRALSEEDLHMFKTDIGRVFTCIKYSEDREKLVEAIKSDDGFCCMEPDAVEVISEYIHDKRLINNVSIIGEEKVDMCKAIDDLINDGIQQGMRQGIEQGREELLMALVKDGEISIISAAKRLNITTEEFAKLIAKN